MFFSQETLIKNLLSKVDYILIGGGMAFTFLKYQDISIGNSLYDPEGFKMIPDIFQEAEKYNTKIILPVDAVCNNSFSNTGDIKTIILDNSNSNTPKGPIQIGIPKDYMGLDIGPNSVARFNTILKQCDTVIWNGPLGVFEFDNFAHGSIDIMKTLSALEHSTTVIGGGDTASCCEQSGLSDKMTHVSTGGGASLELLEGTRLPGLFY